MNEETGSLGIEHNIKRKISLFFHSQQSPVKCSPGTGHRVLRTSEMDGNTEKVVRKAWSLNPQHQHPLGMC